MSHDAKYRYMNDPEYHNVVSAMRSLISSARLAPSEVREAAMLACILEEERRAPATLTTLDEEFQRLKVAVGVTNVVEAKCTCLSISRDPLCYFHGDRDKVKDRL